MNVSHTAPAAGLPKIFLGSNIQQSAKQAGIRNVEFGALDALEAVFIKRLT
jgi:hypothetical protein